MAFQLNWPSELDRLRELLGQRDAELKKRLQRAATQEQLDHIRNFTRKTCDGLKSLSSCVLPTKPVPADSESLLKRLLKAPQFFTDWKESSARSGAAHVLALAKTYDPSFDAAKVAQGRPSKKVDGTDLMASEYGATWKSMRSHATELVEGVDLATYLGMYNADGSRMEKVPAPSSSAVNPQEKNLLQAYPALQPQARD